MMKDSAAVGHRQKFESYYARLHALDRNELRHTLDPADIMGEDYRSKTSRVLKYNELREFGEYRTRRLVQEARDQLESGDLH